MYIYIYILPKTNKTRALVKIIPKTQKSGVRLSLKAMAVVAATHLTRRTPRYSRGCYVCGKGAK